MTKSAIEQIGIAVVATVIAGIVLDRMRRPRQTATAPVADNREPNTWFGGLL